MERIRIIAEDLHIDEILRPMHERNSNLICTLAEVIMLQNELKYELGKVGESAGLAHSGIYPKAVVDEDGNLLGFVFS